MAYAVKEIFVTLQGEGANAGRAAVFCRFSGCNLWNGREADRGSATCQFCDTDFVGTDGTGGGRFTTAEALAEAAGGAWRRAVRSAATPFVVVTGGEPLLQLDESALSAFHRHGFEVAVETNGSLPAPPGIDWICVSPKAGADLVQREGDELKLVYPQADGAPERYENLKFRHFFLQPMAGPRLEHATRLAVQYCQMHPKWRLSLQLHKLIGIP